jgi:putative sigma-54 modulation protein
MDVTFRAHNASVPDAVRDNVLDKVTRLTRFLEGMDHAEVVFSEERNPRIVEREVCEVTLNGHGHLVRARASAADQQAAADRVIDKLEHRIGKLKGKLLDRSHPRRHGPIESPADDQSSDDDQSEPEGPRIVRTKRFSIKPMTPEEAVLQMELLGHGFFFFVSAETERAAVVYRRNDGEFGLIEAG